MQATSGTSSAGPLDGVKILDLTSVVMGPFATQILAQLGAEVTKVESPEGDNMRQVGPMRNPGMGHIFLQANQGKRSIVLDLKTPEGHDAILRLVATSDVLVSNVRPKALADLGLAYESVRAHNQRIIHVSCCGFDQSGPYADRPAYDDLIQGATGVPWLMMQHGLKEPCYAPVTLADRVAGLHAVYAVTAALFARATTGRGQAVVVPMFESMAQFVLGDHLAGLSFEPPNGEPGYARLLTPHRRPYRTLDGYLCVLVYNDKHWKAFFHAIGEPERVRCDPRFASHSSRAANIDAIYEEMGRIMLTRTSAEWRALLDEADVPNMPMNTPRDLLADPHLQATGFIQRFEHPTEGLLNIPGAPTRWSDTRPAPVSRPAPRLGEHTLEVLQELGYSAKQIASMTGSGAAVAANPLENVAS